MQITRESDYAIRCVLYLSHDPDQTVMVEDIAKAKEIPKSFLAKILQKLAKSGIVKSYRGVKGGFRLTKDPTSISLLDVIVAIEGPLAMNKCVVSKKLCNLSDTCSVHPIWVQINGELEERLRKCTFSELLTLK